MIAPMHSFRRAATTERPMLQWEAASGLSSATLRLYGTLGRRDLALVVETIAERARSPRDVLSIDFENVIHLDFRALPEFAQKIARHRHRGASIWLVGLSPYVRCLFDVAGQGSVLRQLAWQSEERGRRSEPSRPFAAGPMDRGHRGGRVEWAGHGEQVPAGADRFPR